MTKNAKLTRYERKVLCLIAVVGLLGLGIIAGGLFWAHESLKASSVEVGESSFPEASAYRTTIATPPPPASADGADTGLYLYCGRYVDGQPMVWLGDQSYAFGLDGLNTQELQVGKWYTFVLTANAPQTVIGFKATEVEAFSDATCADA